METPNRQTIFGGVLVLFGLLFFLRAMGVIDEDNILLSPKMYPLYAAAACFAGKQNKWAIGCLCLSALVWFDDLYYLFNSSFKYIWPLALVVVGALLISGKLNLKALKEKKEEKEAEEETREEDEPFKL